MPDLGIIKLIRENIKTTIPSSNKELHLAKVNFIKVFDIANSLFIGGYTFADKYPYDEGSGFYLFKINTRTGKFTPLLNLLENNEFANSIRAQEGI